MNSAPFRKYRVSSPVIANCVRVTISRMASPASMTGGAPPDAASVGKSSRGNVCMRESKLSAATFTEPLASCRIRISVSGSARTTSYSFFAGTVTAPAVATVAAQPLRSDTSRSVASSRTCSPSASSSTFASTGMVFLRSTIP